MLTCDAHRNPRPIHRRKYQEGSGVAITFFRRVKGICWDRASAGGARATAHRPSDKNLKNSENVSEKRKFRKVEIKFILSEFGVAKSLPLYKKN